MDVAKRGVLLLIILLLIPIAVSAANFNVQIEEIEDSITFGQLAKFRLTITNELGTIEEFKVRTLDYPIWDVTTKPLLNPIAVSVMPKESKEIELFVNPLHISNYGVYDVSLLVELVSKKENVEETLRVNIVSPQAGTYVETVIATISIDDQIDPTEEIPIKIMLNNQNVIEYPNLKVKVESRLINDEIEKSLGKKEKKTISLTKKIDSQTPPQEDALVVKVISNNKTLDTKVARIEIIAHKELKKEEKVKKRFLKTEKEMTLTNIGNVKFDEGVKEESSFIQSLFTSSKPKGKFIKENGIKYLLVPVSIEPNESTKVIITKNYITLLVIALMAIIITILYYLLRSPLTIEKKATNISFREGGVSELKVVLTVSNRSKEKLEAIEIIDRIPNIADLEKGLTIGTLHPDKILRHEKKGTIIKWVIDQLDAGDERVISYKIKSHLSILGEFSLSQAVGKFRFKEKEYITHSNSIGVSP